MRRAFELAERLGMTAFELMDRMTLVEMRIWAEYDAERAAATTKDDFQVAAILAKLDWIKGVKKPDPARYLPKGAGKRRKPKTIGEQRAMIFAAAARTRGDINNGRV